MQTPSVSLSNSMIQLQEIPLESNEGNDNYRTINQVSKSSLTPLNYESQNDLFDHDWILLRDDTEKSDPKLEPISIYIQSENDAMKSQLTEEEWAHINKDNDPEYTNNLKTRWLKKWAFTGGVPLAGTALGAAQQMSGSKAGLSSLQALNFIKQVELKNCAYIVPLAPLFIHIASKVSEDNSNDPLSVKIKKALNSMDKKDLTFILLSCGISLSTAGLTGALIRTGLLAFDLSGHVMTKIVTSAVLAKGDENDDSQKPTLLKRIMSYAYVASDTVMLHKTALHFHTPEELAAGAIWGIINLGVAYVLADKLVAPSEKPIETMPNPKVNSESEEVKVEFCGEHKINIIDDYLSEKPIKSKSIPPIKNTTIIDLNRRFINSYKE